MLLVFHHQSHIWQKFWFSSYGPKCCQPIKLQDSLKCNISTKKWVNKLIFGMQINIEVFCKLILSFWVGAIRHAQSTQNKKFVYLWNISRKAWRVKLIFCLQINTKVFSKLIQWNLLKRPALKDNHLSNVTSDHLFFVTQMKKKTV